MTIYSPTTPGFSPWKSKLQPTDCAHNNNGNLELMRTLREMDSNNSLFSFVYVSCWPPRGTFRLRIAVNSSLMSRNFSFTTLHCSSNLRSRSDSSTVHHSTPQPCPWWENPQVPSWFDERAEFALLKYYGLFRGNSSPTRLFVRLICHYSFIVKQNCFRRVRWQIYCLYKNRDLVNRFQRERNAQQSQALHAIAAKGCNVVAKLKESSWSLEISCERVSIRESVRCPTYVLSEMSSI